MKLIHTFSFIMCIIIMTHLSQFGYSENIVYSPIKQMKNGVSLQNVECNIGLERIFKIHNSFPACVTTVTAEILIQRQTHTMEIHNQTNVIQDKEYRIFSWHDVPKEQKEYIIRMIWIDVNSDPIETAKRSNEKPEVHAAIFLWKFTNGLYTHPNDRCIHPYTNEYTEFRCPWLDNGITTVKERIIEWFDKYKKAGGNLDYLIMDDEFSFSNWSLQTKLGWADAIESDPRFTTLIPKINQTSLELVMNRPYINHPAYLQWNAIQDKMLVDARNRAIFEPIKERYPDVKASNYNDYVVDMDHVISEKNGHKQHYFSNFGTHNAKSFYGDIQQYGSKIGHDSNTVLEWQISTFDAIRDSSDIPNMAWVSHFSYVKSKLNKIDYEKMLSYLICQTDEPLLYWNSNASDTDNKLMYEIISKTNEAEYCK